MATLANFPMVSQLTEITSDGRLSENGAFDCVPASIGAAILYYQGKTQWDTEINPDRLKDAAYGEALHNSGTSASAYVPFCASIGFHLYPVQGNPGQLVQLVHQYLSEGKPVVFTEPDPYVSNSLGWSHVCVFYQDGPGYLVAMDPYIARPVHRTDAEWLNLLLFNEIWIVEEAPMSIAYNTPGVKPFFTETDPQHWKCLQTGKIVQFAILDFYKRFGNSYLCGLTWLGLPQSNEIPLQGSQHGAVKQHFENAVLFYDPAHEFDTRPDAPNEIVYLGKLYSGQGQDPKIADLEAQLAQAKTQATGDDPNKVANRLQALELLGKQIEQLAVSPL